MKKLLSVMVACVMALLLFAACGEKLPEGITEEAVKAAGEAAVKQLSEGDYEAFTTSMTSEMHTALGKDKDEKDAMAEIWAQLITQLGEYESIEKSVVGAKDGYAVYSASMKFASANVTVTISYDKDLKLAGIVFK